MAVQGEAEFCSRSAAGWLGIGVAVWKFGHDVGPRAPLFFGGVRGSVDQLIDHLGMLARVEYASVTEQLEPGATWVVYHE